MHSSFSPTSPGPPAPFPASWPAMLPVRHVHCDHRHCGTRLCTYDSLKITWAPSACLPVRSGQSRVTVRGRRASGFPCSTKMASLVFRLAAGTRHAVQQVPTLARAGNRARDRPLFVQTGVASYVERDARRSTLFHAPCRRVLAKSPYPGISVRLRRRDGSQNRCPSRARS